MQACHWILTYLLMCLCGRFRVSMMAVIMKDGRPRQRSELEYFLPYPRRRSG